MALANCVPEECVEVQTKYDRGDYEGALELYKTMFPVNAAVTAKFGVAGLKYACDKIGYEGGVPRRPLLDLKDEEKEKIEEILIKAKLN